jgi:hypothetical protein
MSHESNSIYTWLQSEVLTMIIFYDYRKYEV